MLKNCSRMPGAGCILTNCALRYRVMQIRWMRPCICLCVCVWLRNIFMVLTFIKCFFRGADCSVCVCMYMAGSNSAEWQNASKNECSRRHVMHVGKFMQELLIKFRGSFIALNFIIATVINIIEFRPKFSRWSFKPIILTSLSTFETTVYAAKVMASPHLNLSCSNNRIFEIYLFIYCTLLLLRTIVLRNENAFWITSHTQHTYQSIIRRMPATCSWHPSSIQRDVDSSWHLL